MMAFLFAIHFSEGKNFYLAVLTFRIFGSGMTLLKYHFRIVNFHWNGIISWPLHLPYVYIRHAKKLFMFIFTFFLWNQQQVTALSILYAINLISKNNRIAIKSSECALKSVGSAYFAIAVNITLITTDVIDI